MAVYWNNAGAAQNWTADERFAATEPYAFLEGSNVEIQDQRHRYESLSAEQQSAVYLVQPLDITVKLRFNLDQAA